MAATIATSDRSGFSRAGHLSGVSPEPRTTARESSLDSDLSYSSKVAHTLTACCRCRQRKTRCDAGLPRCDPCERSGAVCEYFDPTRGRKISRTYVIKLQERVRALEAELERIDEIQNASPDTDRIIRNPGLVRCDDSAEPRFLGYSSGIAMSRLVIELAKHNTGTKTIREIVPNVGLRHDDQIHPADVQQKGFPKLCASPATTLPSRLVTDKLTDIFCQRAQFLFPTLHEPSFRKDVDDVYQGSTDPYQNFLLRMVIAISMQKLDIQYAGLADSYYLAALEYLEAAVRPLNLGTLQCFALIGQYSLLTPTRTAIYYVIGLATRLCQQMGLDQEKTVAHANLNPIEKDLRRRVFWIITSMEYALSHALGRPSSIATDPIDVDFFEPLDDEYITAEKLLPATRSPKKIIAIHFLKMRILQAEVRRTLYQKRRPEPRNDKHPWFSTMELKLEQWKSSSPRNDQGSGLTHSWFTCRYNTVVIFLFRPSPQVPHPSVRAAKLCYDASEFNVRLQRKQIDDRSVDLTWVFVQCLFMAVNTVLWTMSYAEIRRLHPKDELESLLNTALEGVILCSERWPGVASAYGLYQRLVEASLKVYDVQDDSSPPAHQDPSRLSPASGYEGSNQSAMSSPSMGTVASSVSTSRLRDSTSPFGYVFDHQPIPQQTSPPDNVEMPPTVQYLDNLTDPFTNPNLGLNVFPSNSNGGLDFDAATTIPPVAGNLPPNASSLMTEPNIFARPSDNLFAQFLQPQQPLPPQQEPSLSQVQQMELMDTLETTGLEDMGNLLDQGAKFFHASFNNMQW
ncbi:MAG: hypothetical protein M1833_006165 [Piccolia ochrophora]|nr:MAG: hypothetical protein M1833_006165 [Piccolia ochrophora]